MREELIKEALSGNYISIIASKCGFELEAPPRDTGIDWRVSYIKNH